MTCRFKGRVKDASFQKEDQGRVISKGRSRPWRFIGKVKDVSFHRTERSRTCRFKGKVKDQSFQNRWIHVIVLLRPVNHEGEIKATCRFKGMTVLFQMEVYDCIIFFD